MGEKKSIIPPSRWRASHCRGAADASSLLRKPTAELTHPDDLHVQTERMKNIYGHAAITRMVAGVSSGLTAV